MKRTSDLALGAMFLAVMMVLGYIESMIPLGSIPGIKLGLANSVLLLSLYWLGIPFSFALMLAKVLLSGLLFGNPNAMLYALSGGILSMLAMMLMIYGVKGMSPVGAGVAGAVMHNVGQVGVAALQLQTSGLLYYMAILMVVGVGTGFLTGTVALQLMRYLPKERRERFFAKGSAEKDSANEEKA